MDDASCSPSSIDPRVTTPAVIRTGGLTVVADSVELQILNYRDVVNTYLSARELRALADFLFEHSVKLELEEAREKVQAGCTSQSCGCR